MLSLLTSPIFKKFLSLFIAIGIGFYIGYSLKADQLKETRKDKNILKGVNNQLAANNNQLRITNDTLLAGLMDIAKQERIQVDNYITDTKVKDGSQLNFVPKTRATLSVIESKRNTVIPIITLPTTPTGQPTVPTPKEEKERPNFWRRNFGRKHKITQQ